MKQCYYKYVSLFFFFTQSNTPSAQYTNTLFITCICFSYIKTIFFSLKVTIIVTRSQDDVLSSYKIFRILMISSSALKKNKARIPVGFPTRYFLYLLVPFLVQPLLTHVWDAGRSWSNQVARSRRLVFPVINNNVFISACVYREIWSSMT